MNTSRLHLLLAFSLVFLLNSCKLKELVDPIVNNNEEPDETDVNNWIYDRMSHYYLWESDMKSITETDLTLEPEEYFESLLVEPGVLDRFSWIQESSIDLLNSLNGISTSFGIKTKPWYMDNTRSRVCLAIVHALPGSAADEAGLKRGDLITKVNGEDITGENYRTVLQTETATFTLGSYNSGTITDSKTSIEVTKRSLQAEAVQHHSIIELGDKKIGYLVYTQFLTSSDQALNNAFGEFKAAGIDELVIDLRDNGGGYISSAALLSSLIVKNLADDKLMSKQIWNDEQTKYYRDTYGEDALNSYFFTTKAGIGPVNNPGTLDRVYFIVTNGSASSSELVINNLLPYMEVKLVGEHTYGKNVGSITISDDEDRWEWGMQPIVLKTVNRDGLADYGTPEGFPVDISVTDNLLPYLPYGDPDETMLKEALLDILGETTLAKARKSSKVKPSASFIALEKEALLDDPRLNHKDMFITQFPGE
ncbi:S41 family peptidase [Jiulongibacter sp. NS-SX5]|uniref:S41 family peptidase n=1 Tax=Jiulongibacter sp. NS-SX5 TaxID=3463854 RepID=UPI00405A3EDC